MSAGRDNDTESAKKEYMNLLERVKVLRKYNIFYLTTAACCPVALAL